MEQIIYNNVSLRYAIDTITNGTIGLSDDEYLDDIVISKNPAVINPLYDNIFIKPIIVDISQNVLQLINETKVSIEDVETEFIDFVVFAIAKEDNKTVLINKSLSEYLMLFGSDINEVLELQIWNVVKIN